MACDAAEIFVFREKRHVQSQSSSHVAAPTSSFVPLQDCAHRALGSCVLYRPVGLMHAIYSFDQLLLTGMR